MQELTGVVFAGPSLAGLDLTAYGTLEFRPPARQGDIWRAVREKPAAIGIIDGYFEGVPAVWHKEILWSLHQGIPVLGASSMGALRAAEMDAFGNGAIDVQGVDETPAPGPVCFAGGTMILTPRGEILVEDLKVGDMVVTLDDGPMPILWMSKTKYSWPLESRKSKPIEIS
ncbi:MAG: TfuA-like protein, partial [Paracoccaceae bacterium]